MNISNKDVAGQIREIADRIEQDAGSRYSVQFGPVAEGAVRTVTIKADPLGTGGSEPEDAAVDRGLIADKVIAARGQRVEDFIPYMDEVVFPMMDSDNLRVAAVSISEVVKHLLVIRGK